MGFGWHTWSRHAPDQVDDAPNVVDLSKMKKDELIARATALDLQLTGDETKADLVAAILAD